jgi:TolB protein
LKENHLFPQTALSFQRGMTVTKIGVRIAPWLFIFCMACSQTPGGSGIYKIAFVPLIPGQHGIFTMNSDTTGSKLLTADDQAEVRFASWSPDGKKIGFFTVRAEDAGILKKYRMPYEKLLYVMPATGGNQKRLLDFPILDFAWSPDGQQMFFISAHEGADRDSPDVLNAIKDPIASVYVLDVKTGKQTRLPGSGHTCSVSWSPDSTRLAISYGEADNGGIYIVSANGKQSSRLTNAATTDCRPMWSPDGKSIAYVAVPKPDADAAAVADGGVFVINVDGTGKKHVTNEVVYFATWSLDSSMLMLQSRNGVRLVDPDGNKQILLSAGLRTAVNAVFTPDGKRVMFCSNDEGAWNIYSVDLEGKNRKKITGQTNSSNYSLSPLPSNR